MRPNARFAVERHATSKIYSDEDLFRIGTLGFRGEALASIAAVSHFELLTCPDDQESGTRLLMQGGQLDEIGKVGFPQGTRIKIERLFFNTPARLKFLKTTTTELRHIQQGLTNQALAYPQRQFKLVHNQQLLLNLGPANSLEERIFQLFGEEFRDSLQEVSHRENYLNFKAGSPSQRKYEPASVGNTCLSMIALYDVQQYSGQSTKVMATS